MSSKIQIPKDGNVKDVFLYILREIRETQKKIKVKTSRIIKQLEEFLFKANTKKINEDEIRLLLLGDEDAGLPYGLLYCCGSKSKLDGNLRKSSFYAVRFLVTLFEKHPQRKDFLSVYCDLEEDEFKLMNLTSHILSEDKNDMAPFILIRFVKDKRPHISLNSLIDGKKVIEKFETWYKEYRRVQVEEEIKQTTWKEQEDQKKRYDTEDNVMKDQREEKRKKKMRMLEQVKLNSSEKSIDFFIKTFQDPLYLQEQEIKQTKIPQRESQQKRKQITNMMTLSVIPQSQIDLIRDKFRNNNIQIEDVIMKVHIDSKEFDPFYVIQLLHSDTPNSQFIQYTQKLQQVTQEASDIRRNLIYFFFEEIFILNNGITRLQKDFIGKESKSYNQRIIDQKCQIVRLNQIYGKKDDDDQIIGSLIVNNKLLLEEFDKISSNLVHMKKNTQSLRKCLNFMQKLEGLIKLPQQINTAFLQRDFKKILRLCQINKPQLEKFKGLSIFEQLFSDINVTLMNCFKEIIDIIKNESINYENLLEHSLTVLDLPYTLALNFKQLKFDDEKTLLESEEIVTKLSTFALEKQIQKNQIHPSALVILISIKNKIIFDITEHFDVDKGLSKNVNDHWNTERLKGDLINEFLKFSGQQQQQIAKNQKQQIKKTVVLNCKTVEKYFQQTFISQFSNFYTLCLNFQSGQLDYRIGVTKQNDEIPNSSKINYAEGSSIIWSQAINLIFQEIVSIFIKSFDRFTKKLQQNWFQDDEFSRESQLFYQRVRNDLEIMGNIFYHFELLLDNVQKSLLEKTKGLKTELLILYMKILFEEFRNITVKQCIDQDYPVPEKDFFGFQFSSYSIKILSELSNIFQNLGKFHLHEGLYSSNKEIYIQFLTKTLSEAIQTVKQEMFNEKHFKDCLEADINKEKQYRALLFMHNLRLLQEESKEGLMNYTLIEVYNNLQYTDKSKICSQEIQSALSHMLLNLKVCRKQYRMIIQMIYGQIVTKENLKELAIQQINNIFQQYYPQVMSQYKQFLLSEFHSNGDINISSSTTPRPFLFKWLSLVNEQVCTISLLQPIDKDILDQLASLIYESLFIQIEKIIKQDDEEESRKSNLSRSSKTSEQQIRPKQTFPITFWRQIITEIQIFDQILTKLKGAQTEIHSKNVKNLLCQKLNINNLDDIFNDEDLSNQKNNIIRNFKYKISQNFKALFI